MPAPTLSPMSCVALEKSLDLSETGKGYNLTEFCWIRDNIEKVLSIVPDMQPQRDEGNLSFGANLCSSPGYTISCCVILGKLLGFSEPGKEISMAPNTQ